MLCLTAGVCHAVLYAPPDDWTIDGPGGPYGVYSYHSQYSYIWVGPFDIEVRMGFHGTRILFLAVLATLTACLAWGTLLIVRQIRKRNAEPSTAR